MFIVDEDREGSLDRLKEYWDKIWGGEDETATQISIDDAIADPYLGIRNSRLMNEVLGYLGQQEDPVILEAGCGQGIWVIELDGKGYQIHGLDYSLTGLQAASAYKSGLSLVSGDILHLPFKDESFDAILSWGVVEHFEDFSLLDRSLKEKVRVLRPGGQLFITVPVENMFLHVKGVIRGLPGLRRFTRPSPFFENKFLVDGFLDFLRKAGFEVTTWRYHATEFGLAMTLPSLFQSQDDAGRYRGLTIFGKLVHGVLVRRFAYLAAHQMFVIAGKPL